MSAARDRCHQCQVELIPLVNFYAREYGGSGGVPGLSDEVDSMVGAGEENTGAAMRWGGGDLVLMFWLALLVRFVIGVFARTVVFLGGGTIKAYRRAKMRRLLARYPRSLLCPRCRKISRRL